MNKIKFYKLAGVYSPVLCILFTQTHPNKELDYLLVYDHDVVTIGLFGISNKVNLYGQSGTYQINKHDVSLKVYFPF